MKIIGAILFFAALALLVLIPVEFIVESFRATKEAEDAEIEEEEV